MALYVNTNTSSINSQRKLAVSTRKLDTSYERLSSGLRINSAKDDAAGLQISNRMTSQINGLTQGNRNANDGISMCQVTEGALDEVTNMLQRMRTLAIQSANGTNSSAERDAINQEVQQLSKEICRIGHDTTYGLNKHVFEITKTDGNSKDVTFQVGSNSNQVITMEFKALTALITDGTLKVMSDGTGINVSTTASSQDAIDALSNIIRNIDSYRADMGAVQNRLESTISNQENVIENVSDARSRIRDVDYAAETAEMSQLSILQQASTTILTQANQKTQIALNLLQG